MNLGNLTPEEYIHQFESKMVSDGASQEEVKAFRNGVNVMIGWVSNLNELSVDMVDAAEALNGYQLAWETVEGGCDV